MNAHQAAKFALGARPAGASRPEGDALKPLVIELRGVGKDYEFSGGRVSALRSVDLTVAAGEAVALKGVSGSGKSTMLHIIGAIERPTSGAVRVCGEDPAALDYRSRASFRARRIGFIFQFFNLIPTLTARENVIAALEPLGGTSVSRDASAVAALGSVGLADRLDRYPAQLSGGEQQRVAIARAIAKRPAVLLADEPTGALDEATAIEVLALLNDVRRESGCAILLATHDPAVSKHVDRVVRLEGGRLLPE